ncbi:hypothetical protein IEO70_12985 [Bacillus sp. AGMB 02131]|uniref:Calcineurin-like phosphoesterase domain-containing protein n=1 Tax=Peribacillus faecalis TaxID=2772559 RepID=A0A927CWX6_9BACI|nr:hypothetical protein [Peribacillus faecalis]MBD3109262.1 hypothetical protein [Peribacillus faecalis]
MNNDRIAMLADVHGNTSALKAVVEDCVLQRLNEQYSYKQEVIEFFRKRHW